MNVAAYREATDRTTCVVDADHEPETLMLDGGKPEEDAQRCARCGKVRLWFPQEGWTDWCEP